MPHRWKWFSQTRIKNRALIRQRKANSARALFSSEKRKTQQKRSPASRHLTWYWAFPDCSDFQRIDPSPVRKRTFHGLLFGVEMYCFAKSHAQKCAGYSSLWRTDGCDFSRRRKELHRFHYDWFFRVRYGVQKRKAVLLSKQDCLNLMSYPVSSLRIRLKCAAQINLGSKKKISRGNFPRLIFSCPVPSGLPHRSHWVPMNMNGWVSGIF